MWIIFALSASILWGLTYVIDEQIYKKISVSTSLAIGSLLLFIFTFIWTYFNKTLSADISAITSSKRLLFFVITGSLTLIAAEIFIGLSISNKSATLAGLIEISYPIFIALFAYVLFKESSVNLSTVIGGSLIFIGVFIIYYFNG